jgi:hypothetical protein
MRMRHAAVALVLAAVTPAAADPAPAPAEDPQVARADALFAEAQAKLAAGELEAACAKFDESLRLNSAAIGTLMNVARCDAKLGRLAHAVAHYTDARDRGREQNLDAYVKAATEQLTELTPQVPHLALTISEPLPGMTIVVDDAAVALTAAGDVALDPGAHSITVSAPDRLPFETKIDLAKSEHKALSVPALAHPTSVAAAAPHTPGGSPLTGELLTVGGGALVGASVIVGLIARSHYNSALSNHCSGDASMCDTTGVSDTDSARTLGNVGTIVGVVGVATAAAGVVLWLRAGRESAAHGVAVAPVASPDLTGIVAVGHF